MRQRDFSNIQPLDRDEDTQNCPYRHLRFWDGWKIPSSASNRLPLIQAS
jgi:hypothetical protein